MTKLIRRILTCAIGIASIGIGSVFAANASVKSASADSVTGNGTATLKYSAAPTSGSTTTDTSGATWTFTTDSSYIALDSKTIVHVGSGKKAATYIKFTTPDYSDVIVSSIVVNGHMATSSNVSASVTINGTSLGDAQAVSATAADYTFKNTEGLKGDVEISLARPSSATKAIYFTSAVITYAAEGGGPVAVTGVSLNTDSLDFNVGETATLTETVAPSNADDTSVTWSTSDSNVATVDNGVVTAVGIGKATITVTTTDGGFTASCAVSVTNNVADTIDRATTEVTNGLSTYTAWSEKTGTTGTVYAGCSAGGNDSIQLRSKSSDSGLWNTTSIGRIAKVALVFQTSTGNGKQIDIYGSTTRYENASELYDESTQGTLLGSIIKGTSTSLEVTGNYTYIGVRSNDGAIYVSSISFFWDTSYSPVQGFVDTFMHMDANVDGQCNASETNYYAKAKVGLFAALSTEQIATFKSDDTYNDAQARYEAWAAACGDTKPYVADYSYQSARVNGFERVVKDNAVSIIVVISSLALASTAAFLFLKKKKVSK